MGYTSIVCGVTGSAHAQKAALEAGALAKRDNAKLTYVVAELKQQTGAEVAVIK